MMDIERHILKRHALLVVALLAALALTCGDDSGEPTPDGGGGADSYVGDGVLPWPDVTAQKDSKPWSCTPGEDNMCDGYKTQYCNNGTCTNCPADRVDCDRQGDCECFGACNGTQCVKGGG